MHSICQKQNIYFTCDDTWDDLFFRLFLERLEPCLNTDACTFIRDFPPSQCALARIGPSGWTERFELFWKGLEIANAYHELNDPVEQQRRIDSWQEHRLRLGRPTHKSDPDFIRHLQDGLPPASGVALGLERLAMALFNVADLKDLRYFSNILL